MGSWIHAKLRGTSAQSSSITVVLFVPNVCDGMSKLEVLAVRNSPFSNPGDEISASVESTYLAGRRLDIEVIFGQGRVGGNSARYVGGKTTTCISRYPG